MAEWKEGPSDESELLRRTHDALPSAVLTVDADGDVIYRNETARAMLPSIEPGTNLRAALERLTHVEKVDRLLIRREIATFAAAPGGPELHWMVWEKPDLNGLLVLTVWEVDWSELMTERRAEFMMAASHELRGPLTALRGFSEILNMNTSNLTPEQAEAATIIETTARHLTVLVEDVFDLSRNSFGELRLNLSETDLAGIIDSAGSALRARIEDRGQSLTCEIEAGLPLIEADPARARQMITNLINNASIHNPEGTTIEVNASVKGDYIEVEITDDGDGLPFERPEEAFRSFRRGESATAGDRTGSGIGLSLTKRLIELHRGRVSVRTSPGAGTSFTLFFPVDRQTAPVSGEPGPV